MVTPYNVLFSITGGATESDMAKVDMLLSETFDLNGAFVGMCYNPDFVSSILVPSFA